MSDPKKTQTSFYTIRFELPIEEGDAIKRMADTMDISIPDMILNAFKNYYKDEFAYMLSCVRDKK